MTKPTILNNDGVLHRRLIDVPHEDRLYSELVQPSRETILNRNAELRKNPGALRSDALGLHKPLRLDIPIVDRVALFKKYPDLQSPDMEIKHKAWMKFYHSSESLPYRVEDR